MALLLLLLLQMHGCMSMCVARADLVVYRVLPKRVSCPFLPGLV
jgi:hypothetical protein